MSRSDSIFNTHRTMKFHLELTDKCNAACPMCGRTKQMDRCLPDLTKVRNIELELELIKRNFTPDLCSRISEIDLRGGLGDPPAAQECLEIREYLVGFGIKIILSSNGGLRSEAWWKRLRELFRGTESLVEFHIDGLEDTNHLYRVNTRFDKIMRNAQAYLESGAIGEWHFIPFQHDEHQLADALKLSREMGFSNFRVIDTIRFARKNGFTYQLPDGSMQELNPADPSLINALRNDTEEEEPATHSENLEQAPTIQCKSEIQNRPYIVATGAVSACCWIEGSDDERRMYSKAGVDHGFSHNIRHRALEEILLEEPYRTVYPQAWAEQSNPVCVRKCAKMQRSRRSFL